MTEIFIEQYMNYEVNHKNILEHSSDPETEIQLFKSVLTKELTSDLAQLYTDSLISYLGGLDQPIDEFIQNGSIVHKYIGENLYGPLICGYVIWLEQKIAYIYDQGPVYFALRDGAPFYTAAQVLWKNKNLQPAGVYINRPILGIEDEIAQEKGRVDNRVYQYLAAYGIHKDTKIILSDSGAWGTVVKEIKTNLLPNTSLYPLFWYSHNPYIDGYTNELLEKYGLDPAYGEILNDSLECLFPQTVERPISFMIQNGTIDVALTPSCRLSVVWGKSALSGVSQAASNFDTTEIELESALRKLIFLSEKAKQAKIWTGVLPTHSPTWSKGDEFIQLWPASLLP
ncbi:hypothetical protein A2154_05180 [Candidatus Gottesmanbacteria bacterium RBG_16_43_7]|uniref:Uncharacterized protein n=1 Tax=Candidatus Gottesmanbacteria bacterium RBG_16_43_7 TaxID=1798373 RepID=A0A1F5ZCH9_9BACT|nr:MAG: hypothetical protein A2154_05180 [Candidatus Gottesmanbacteria bacterium RBG_16_43_7]